MKNKLIIPLILMVFMLMVNGCSPSESEVIEEEQVVVDESAVEDSRPEITAFEVGELLLNQGIPFIAWEYPFPDDTFIVDVIEISDAQLESGMLSKSMAVTELNDTWYDWRIEVYESIEARNAARIRMVDANPGAAHIAECGEILIYIIDPSDNEEVRDLSRQAYSILRDNLECQ